MSELTELTREELAEKYYHEFGMAAEHYETKQIIAALWFGKRVNYLTYEELNEVELQS